jgi:Ca-activated chloride channel family protein
MANVIRTIGAIALAGLLTATAAHAQEPGAAGTAGTAGTRFSSGIDMVALSVVVTDAQGKFLGGLSADDFTVIEDGVAQPVSFFASTPVPIDLAILLDISASMSDRIQTVQQAAIGFTSSMHSGDRITVVGIKDAVRVLHPLDEDVTAARTAIQGTKASGNTALYNALYLTLREMVKHRRSDGEVRRQAIVVLSDGEDTTSIVGVEDVMELAKQSGVAVYTITLRSPYAANLLVRERPSYAAAEYGMRSIAQETGARAFFPIDIKELAGVYRTIAVELANQYLLGYASSNTRVDGSYRRVTVRVDRPGTRTRTRAGYVAAPPSSVALR